MGELLKTNNMKISEVIKKLQEIQKEHGDIESSYYTGYFWHSTDCIKFNVNNKILYFE